MPKRPPRVARELAIPHDLRGAGPTRAHATRTGELWHADVLALLGRIADRSVDLVVTDPPYAIAKESWDEFESLDAYVAWCDAWLAEIARVLAPHGSAYVCGFSEILAEIKGEERATLRRLSLAGLVLQEQGEPRARLGPLARIDLAPAQRGHARRRRRRAHTLQRPHDAVSGTGAGRVSQYGRGVRRDRWVPNPLGAKPRDVLEIPVLCNGMTEKTPHATQKPEALIERLILASSAAGQLVVDPFVGSGTTAVVAARLGRRWLAGDADARYVGLARERVVAAC